MTGRAESSRFVWVGTAGMVLILLSAVLVVAFWPRLELAYHGHYFRRGSPEQQVEAFEWICVHWLREGMTKEEVERVLGERLEGRFERLGPEGTHSEAMYLFGGSGRGGGFGTSAGSLCAYVLAFRPGTGLKQFVCYEADRTLIFSPEPWSAEE